MLHRIFFIVFILLASWIAFSIWLTNTAAESLTRSPVWSIAFSPDGKYLAAGMYQRVVIWELSELKNVQELGSHIGAVRALRFSPDGNWLAAGGGLPGESGELKIWKLGSPEPLLSLSAHSDTVEALAFNSDGVLFSTGMDEVVLAHKIPEGEKIRALTEHVNRVLAIDGNKDGRYIATGSADKTIKVWDAKTFEVLINFDQNEAPINSIAFLPTGNEFLSGGDDRSIKAWRIQELQEGGTNSALRPPPSALKVEGALFRVYNGHQGSVYSIATHPNGELFVSGGADRNVILWDVRSGRQIRRFQGSSDQVYAVAFSPDGNIVAAAGRDGIVRLWDANSGKLKGELKLFSDGGAK